MLLVVGREAAALVNFGRELRGEGAEARVARLRLLLKAQCMRRTAALLADRLPPKTTEIVHVDVQPTGEPRLSTWTSSRRASSYGRSRARDTPPPSPSLHQVTDHAFLTAQGDPPVHRELVELVFAEFLYAACRVAVEMLDGDAVVRKMQLGLDALLELSLNV